MSDSDLQFWEDRIPMHYSVRDATERMPHPVVATATSAWNTEKRRRHPRKDKLYPMGVYPIADVADLKKAIQALGRAKNRAKVVKHIKKRARALGQWALAKDLKERV